MDIEELQKKCKKWQKRLGLSDWGITVAFRDARDMEHAQGCVIRQTTIQCADIRLMNIEDRQESDRGGKDPELDLVHELIHVRLWAIDPKDVDVEGTLHICREQSIDWIAKALLAAEREGK